MQPGRYFNNGPRWPQNPRLPSNGVNFLLPQPSLGYNATNLLHQQQMLMPWMQLNSGMPRPLLPGGPRRPLVHSTPMQYPQHQRRPPKRRYQETDSTVPLKSKRQNGNNNEQSSNDQSSSSPSSSNKFVVPISKGTEKITIEIWDYFLANQMTEDDLKNKLQLRKSLLSVMEEAFPDCRLFLVGSSMTGFATRTSDIDMCFVISEEDIDQKKEATVVLSAIARALRRCSFVYAPQVIRAKVPILKFRDKIAGVECDLNINNTVGVRNTHLLRYYAYMDWRVRPLMLFIKRWARFHDINDASKKTISSYSLSLMLIHFLQDAVKPEVLPCLQQMRPDLFSRNIDVRNLSLKMEKIEFSSSNTSTLGELFLGFLHYYSSVFRYDSDVVSVRTGKKLRMTALDPDQWKHLSIEEPFERSNTARSVYDLYVFQRIRRVFATSFQKLSQYRDCRAILSHPF